jgi:hypothetical protein
LAKLSGLHTIPSTPHTERKAEELEDILHDRVYRWVYAEAQARGRIIVMFEREVIKWAATKGLTPSSVGAVR